MRKQPGQISHSLMEQIRKVFRDEVNERLLEYGKEIAVIAAAKIISRVDIVLEKEAGGPVNLQIIFKEEIKPTGGGDA